MRSWRRRTTRSRARPGPTASSTNSCGCLLEAEKAAWRAGTPAIIARVSACRGDALQALGREDEAERACREVIEWSRNHGVQAESLPAVFCLAQMLWRRGRLAEAATELGAARAVANTHPTERGRRSIDMLLGMVALSPR